VSHSFQANKIRLFSFIFGSMHAGTVQGSAGAWDTEAGRNQTTLLYYVRPTMVRFFSLTAAAFAARVSVAQTRVLQEEYNLEGDAYTVALEMATFTTTSFQVDNSIELFFFDDASDIAIQSILCGMNENVIFVDHDDHDSYLCGEEAIDASDLSSYVLLLNAPFYVCSTGSRTFPRCSCTFHYRVLHIGDKYASSFLGDGTTTTEETLELLRTHWQSVLVSRCYDGTFDTLLYNYAVEQSHDPTIYCSPYADQAFMEKKLAALKGRERTGAHATIPCSVVTTMIQWIGLGLPHLVLC
jgi:hypothetical protein